MVIISLYCLSDLMKKRNNLIYTNIDGVYQVLVLKPGNKLAFLHDWFPRLEVLGFLRELFWESVRCQKDDAGDVKLHHAKHRDSSAL